MKRDPLSKPEYGIYVEQISTENTAYNLLLKIDLGNQVDLGRLTKAVRTVVDAHPLLKTAFAIDEKGEAYRYVREDEIEVKVIELTTWTCTRWSGPSTCIRTC